ncbi:hypothetical protein A1Q2_01923 [Trichosporon asahii var. asahii CBS 8904]|uniref:tRNA (adenine(58)-N(1))-methyltransferase catalytic subunit TRM61 n=1 Tax=Trichosporon asahii var. asahii (strain CBS 8904) TaxID=1220162 RepID=K1VIF1_TRIAC|nr:hypothetical protein A1Q2_01923 [Trichosporon asahii var. asahii CBS 8904]
MTTVSTMTTEGKSMFHSRVHIEAGDLVILFMSRDNMTAITVTPGASFHNKFGMYKHDDMIGMKYGSKSGYLHLLRPTPELWTLSLPHRTQILYMPDIAYITMRLGVRVGGRVIEAGTGSGSMTHSLSRAVGPSGHVHSFEYHKARFEKAGNVCKDGFGDVENVEAIFLDLPAPWEAIPFAVKNLNVTRICCFSPCIEQVLKTATTLREEGFTDVSTVEVLTRTYDLAAAPPPHSHALQDVSSIADKLRDHERRKEERRVIQMKNARAKARAMKEKAEREAAGAPEPSTEEGKMDVSEEDAINAAAAAGRSARTKARGETEPDAAEPGAESAASAAGTKEEAATPAKPVSGEPDVAWSRMTLTKPSPEMRGHTSYLTFATLYPAAIRAEMAN